MNTRRPILLSRALRVLVAAGLASACVGASADSAIDRAQRSGSLVAGVDYVVPAYQAGAKFRTPEGIDTALAEDIAKRLNVELTTLRAEPDSENQLLDAGKAHVVLATVGDDRPLGAHRRAPTIVPTGYAAAAMAIMRTDTDIKTWQQLKGRTVCLSEGGEYVGKIASRYGAIEKVFKAPADSLLALRIGGCDAAVHDSAMLTELLKLPEWKKFSATLPARSSKMLAFIVPPGDAKTERFVQQVAAKWRDGEYIAKLMNKRARSIAFEVYLDQDVPDCH